jgi:hypothetical protein
LANRHAIVSELERISILKSGRVHSNFVMLTPGPGAIRVCMPDIRISKGLRL